MFDVTMSSYDGAEVCEIVGLYLLEKLSTLIDKKKIGLYRDDGFLLLTMLMDQNLIGYVKISSEYLNLKVLILPSKQIYPSQIF